MYVYVYKYIYIYTINIHTLVYMYIYIYRYTHIYIYIYVCVCIYIYTCVYIYIYTHTHTHTHTHTQRTQMLQLKRRDTIGWRSTRVRMTFRAFPLLLERQSSSLLSFVRFSYQFNSVICLSVQRTWTLNTLISYYFYTYIFGFVLYFSCLNGCVGWLLCCRMWVWNGLPLNTYISMYTRTKRRYNEWGSTTNYVRSSIAHCTGKLKW